MRKPLLLILACLLSAFCAAEAVSQSARRDSAGARPGAQAGGTLHLVIDAREKQLLGGFDGRRWLDAVKAMPLLKAGAPLRLYSLTGPAGTATAGQPKPPEYPCDDIVEVEVSPVPEGEEEFIAVNGSWEAQPRQPRVQSTDHQEYRDVVGSYLRGRGLSRPTVSILQLMRVDLDGDGTEEVLISASSTADPFAKMFMGRGDFSVLLLRRVVRGKAQTVPIISEIELKNHRDPIMTGQWHHKVTVAAVLDINGDGRMEVVAALRSFRDMGKSVYEVSGPRPREVLSWYCSGGH